MYHVRLLSILAVSLLRPTSGYGQTSVGSEQAEISIAEIVVTVQKRETLLHQTPMAVSAFGRDYLKDSQIAHPVDIGHRTPEFSL